MTFVWVEAFQYAPFSALCQVCRQRATIFDAGQFCRPHWPRLKQIKRPVTP